MGKDRYKPEDTSRGAAQRRELLQDRPRLNRTLATSTRAVRARIRHVAGCAMPTGSVGNAGATA